MASWPVLAMAMIGALACGGPREVAAPRAGDDAVAIGTVVRPACNWKGRSCYESRERCLLGERTQSGTDPTACTDRDEVACFRVNVDLPDTVCSPSLADCEIARTRLNGPSYTNTSPCFLVRYTR